MGRRPFVALMALLILAVPATAMGRGAEFVADKQPGVDAAWSDGAVAPTTETGSQVAPSPQATPGEQVPVPAQSVPEAEFVDGATRPQGHEAGDCPGDSSSRRARASVGAGSATPCGDDLMFGEHGKDRLIGGAGRDRMSGGAGSDRFEAKDKSRDRIHGGAGTDTAIIDSLLDAVAAVERRR